MPRIKIGIIEDEMVIARTIESTLDELGYECCGPASGYGEALELLETDKPDLVLLDINLSGKKDGIDLAEKINLLYQIPFIFLTANSDMATIELAKKVKPHAYIVKPFNKEELFAAIEIAFSNYTAQRNVADSPNSSIPPPAGSTFLKDGKRFHRVAYTDILYVESDNNYTAVYLANARKLLMRSSFTDFLATLPPSMFVRIHRSYAVNTSRLDSIDMEDVTVGSIRVPLSKSYRDSVMKTLGIND